MDSDIQIIIDPPKVDPMNAKEVLEVLENFFPQEKKITARDLYDHLVSLDQIPKKTKKGTKQPISKEKVLIRLRITLAKLANDPHNTLRRVCLGGYTLLQAENT